MEKDLQHLTLECVGAADSGDRAWWFRAEIAADSGSYTEGIIRRDHQKNGPSRDLEVTGRVWIRGL